jgi:hypothetical protein
MTILIAFGESLLFTNLINAQSADCDYDRQQPSLEHAENIFMTSLYSFDCAVMEISDLLNRGIDAEIYARAKFLLGQAYWGQIIYEQSPIPDTQMVIHELIEGFKADSSWVGEWYWMDDDEFLSIAETARYKADSIMSIPPPQKGKWYKKWWAIGSGVGIVAVAIVAFTRGGEDEPPVTFDTIPYFPDPPGDR